MVNVDYTELTPEQLVDLLADKTQRNDVIRALVGGLTATELRRVNVTEAARQALINGLKHPNSKVRWWCIQRRHALHAMTCHVCKPDRQPLTIDTELRSKLEAIARLDVDHSVREVALHELTELNDTESP